MTYFGRRAKFDLVDDIRSCSKVREKSCCSRSRDQVILENVSVSTKQQSYLVANVQHL